VVIGGTPAGVPASDSEAPRQRPGVHPPQVSCIPTGRPVQPHPDYRPHPPAYATRRRGPASPPAGGSELDGRSCYAGRSRHRDRDAAEPGDPGPGGMVGGIMPVINDPCQ
jgi:hypothetical protein